MRGFGTLSCMGKPDDILKRFGDRVRQLRKDGGYSQESFADEEKRGPEKHREDRGSSRH